MNTVYVNVAVFSAVLARCCQSLSQCNGQNAYQVSKIRLSFIYPEGHCSKDREQLLLSILNTVSFPLVPRSPLI